MRLELLCLLMSAVPKAMAFAPSSLRPSHLRPTMAPPQRRASAPLLLDRRHALGAALGVALSTMLSSPSSAAPPESAKGGSVSLGGAANTLAAPAPASGPWPYSTLIEEIDRQRVASARISDDGKQVLATDVDGGIHDSTIFSASDLIGRLTKAHTKFEISPPDADPARPLAEAFLGRNVETYQTVSNILDRRLVTIAGPAGVGKSTYCQAMQEQSIPGGFT